MTSIQTILELYGIAFESAVKGYCKILTTS